jgi:hypothetical protein
LVAQGQTQIPGVDDTDSFAPVVCFETIRTNRLAQAVLRRQVVHQSDVETAFLLADMEEECYLELPQGFIIDVGKVGLFWRVTSVKLLNYVNALALNFRVVFSSLLQIL